MTGLEKEIAELEQKLVKLSTAKTELEKDWQKLWAGIALTKINPPEQMQAWRTQANLLQQSIIELMPKLENIASKQRPRRLYLKNFCN